MQSYIPYTTCTLSTSLQQSLPITPYRALRFAPDQWSPSHLGEERLTGYGYLIGFIPKLLSMYVCFQCYKLSQTRQVVPGIMG